MFTRMTHNGMAVEVVNLSAMVAGAKAKTETSLLPQLTLLGCRSYM
jgi:hypothetical protein